VDFESKDIGHLAEETDGSRAEIRLLLFDWGDTVMRDFPEYAGPMYLWPKVEAVAGAKAAIEQLKAGRIIALATNARDSSEEEIRKALGRVDLDRLFDRVFCFANVGHLKPSAEFFEHVLNELGLPPGAAVMVGDSFEADILGANRAGLFGIWLNAASDDRRRADRYETIGNLAELPAIIAKLTAIVDS
jgi:HAD superfamily hydrolase (TIGR01509 family)